MPILARLKSWARDIKRDVHALYLASRDPRVPWYAKFAAVCVAAYALSPIDLIPDFIPVLGYPRRRYPAAARHPARDKTHPAADHGRAQGRRCSGRGTPHQPRWSRIHRRTLDRGGTIASLAILARTGGRHWKPLAMVGFR